MEFAFIGTTYRAAEEEQTWMARDPIALFSHWLVERGHCSQTEIDALERSAQAEVEEAVAFAESSPFPESEAAFQQVFVS
jgi:pyruvate dehydrogenase E1 component alpha subunit